MAALTPLQQFRDAVWDADDLSHVEALVLLAYANFAHGDPLQAWIADRPLMRKCKIRSKGTPKTVRDSLIKKGWLAPLRELEGHSQITVYALMIPTAPLTGAVTKISTAPVSEQTAPVSEHNRPGHRGRPPRSAGKPPRSAGTTPKDSGDPEGDSPEDSGAAAPGASAPAADVGHDAPEDDELDRELAAAAAEVESEAAKRRKTAIKKLVAAKIDRHGYAASVVLRYAEHTGRDPLDLATQIIDDPGRARWISDMDAELEADI